VRTVALKSGAGIDCFVPAFLSAFIRHTTRLFDLLSFLCLGYCVATVHIYRGSSVSLSLSLHVLTATKAESTEGRSREKRKPRFFSFF
jgi:hypothetical protein